VAEVVECLPRKCNTVFKPQYHQRGAGREGERERGEERDRETERGGREGEIDSGTMLLDFQP
jgi:hypothetical protein